MSTLIKINMILFLSTSVISNGCVGSGRQNLVAQSSCLATALSLTL